MPLPVSWCNRLVCAEPLPHPLLISLSVMWSEPAARPPRGYGTELSPREQQVAELLARSSTDHDIAQTLFLSPRTVERHVANVLKKLGTDRKEMSTTNSPGGQVR